MIPRSRLTLVYSYACTNAISALLHAREVRTLSSEYGEQVTLVLEVREAEATQIAEEAREVTAGSASVQIDTLP